MALAALGDAGEGLLHFSGNRVVDFATAVPGSIEMGFEVTDDLGDGFDR